jgi:hypothetical protein
MGIRGIRYDLCILSRPAKPGELRMHKRVFFIAAIIAMLAFAGCGGGGSSPSAAVGNTGGNGSQTASVVTQDLFNLNGSDLLDTLEIDAGITVPTSVVRSPQTAVSNPSRMISGPFVFQATGGTATIARSGNSTSPGVGFLMTYRDPSGLCECSSDTPSLPLPYKANIHNPLWLGGASFGTAASSTTLGIGFKSTVDSANHGGTYTATVTVNPPGGSTTFTIPNASIALPRQSAPTVSFQGNAAAGCPVGSAYVSWTGAAGTNEYFVAFLTHLNNDPVNHPAFTVVGFVLTNRQYTCVAPGNFYSNAPYQALIIASDTPYISVYDSQGKSQKPTLPPQIDFTVSQITPFTTP